MGLEALLCTPPNTAGYLEVPNREEHPTSVSLKVEGCRGPVASVETSNCERNPWLELKIADLGSGITV